MIENEEKISDEDLRVLLELQRRQEVALKDEEMSELKHKLSVLIKENANLTRKNTILKIYLKYNLTSKDSIDQNSGAIARVVEEEKEENYDTVKEE